MARVPVNPNSPVRIRCEHNGIVEVPLFSPPYTVNEFNNLASEDWGFGYSLTLPHACSIFGGGFPGQTFITGFIDIVLNPFTYFKTTYGTVGATPLFQSGLFGLRAGNEVYQITFGGGSSKKTGYRFLSPQTLNVTADFSQLGSVFSGITSGAIVQSGTGIGTWNGMPWAFIPYSGISLGGRDFFGWDLTNERVGNSFQIADFPGINPPAMNGLLPQILPDGFLGTLNYSPIGQVSGGFGAPFVLEWSPDAFTNGQCRLLRPIFDDAQISAALNGPNSWDCQTVPSGFLYISTLQTISTQRLTFVLMSRDCSKYKIIKLIPQSAAANACATYSGVNFSSGYRVFLDYQGVFYMKQANLRAVIFNSQGFSFPFQFDASKLPYLDLPCWPPCYGVPLFKGNVL